MKNLILSVIILFAFSYISQAQTETQIRKKIAETRIRVALGQAKKAHLEDSLRLLLDSSEYNLNAISVSLEVKAHNQQEFEDLCKTHAPELEKFKRGKPSAHVFVMYSCEKKGNQVTINTYVESMEPKVVVATHNLDIQQRISKIDNTIKMIEELDKALDQEIKYNQVEIVENTGDLLLKHVSVPFGDEVKDAVIDNLELGNDFQDEKPIENKTANIVNKTVETTEKVLEIIPGGDKITNHLLWKLFKSTPEVGKGLGHTATIINIYFRRTEYQNQIRALIKEKELLLSERNNYNS